MLYAQNCTCHEVGNDSVDLQLGYCSLTNNQLSGSLPSSWSSMDQVSTYGEPALDLRWCALGGSTLCPISELSCDFNRMIMLGVFVELFITCQEGFCVLKNQEPSQGMGSLCIHTCAPMNTVGF